MTGKRIGLLVVLLLMSSPCFATIVSETYSEFTKGLLRQLAEVPKARDLSPVAADLAERIAAEWVYTGPCEGDRRKLSTEASRVDVISFVLNASPASGLGAAVLEMISIMTRSNLGRKPAEYICRFALETAEPYTELSVPL